MKISIEQNEGTPLYQRMDAYLNDDCDIDQFGFSLECLVKSFWGNHVQLSIFEKIKGK